MQTPTLITNSIRYRYTYLLLWAGMALVTNPVWHAISHSHSESHVHITDRVSDAPLAQDDLCPHCDAVTQIAFVPVESTPMAPVVLVGDLEIILERFPELRHHRSTRLRAPPFFV